MQAARNPLPKTYRHAKASTLEDAKIEVSWYARTYDISIPANAMTETNDIIVPTMAAVP
ncbi:MAG: hypothetical protein AMXMBFR67_34310 [Nitrospira sp.]